MKTTIEGAFVLTTLALAFTGCAASEPAGGEEEDVAEAGEAVIYYPDGTPDPIPTSADNLTALGVVTFYPGGRACFGELPANQSAGISGQFAFQGLTKYPKLQIYWRRNTGSQPSKIYGGDVIPDSGGFYTKVLNTSNGNSQYFPGLFNFCLRNPSVNQNPFQTNATVVTF